jgi:hypothetical protein
MPQYVPLMLRTVNDITRPKTIPAATPQATAVSVPVPAARAMAVP